MPPTPEPWVNVSTHAVTLASGHPLAPGERGLSDMDDPHDQALRDSGQVIKAESRAEPATYADQTVEQLAAVAAARDVEVTGTGKDGRPVKQDYIAALEAADNEEAKS